MDDTCVISDPGDIDSATLTVDGLLEPTPSRTPAYSGKCKIKQENATYDNLAGHVAARASYVGSIPLSGPDLKNGMIWGHKSSRRDPLLVGKRFEVVAVLHSTYAVQRKVMHSEIP
jgi:hypothetical protein